MRNPRTELGRPRDVLSQVLRIHFHACHFRSAHIPYQEHHDFSFPWPYAKDLRVRVRSPQLSGRSPLLVLDKQSSRRYHPKYLQEASRVQGELAQLLYVYFYDRRSCCVRFHPLDLGDTAQLRQKYPQMNLAPNSLAVRALAHHRVETHPRCLRELVVHKFSYRRALEFRARHLRRDLL